jgi:hypothetical protein
MLHHARNRVPEWFARMTLSASLGFDLLETLVGSLWPKAVHWLPSLSEVQVFLLGCSQAQCADGGLNLAVHSRVRFRGWGSARCRVKIIQASQACLDASSASVHLE